MIATWQKEYIEICFPHDYPDIFLDHIAKYAYKKDIKHELF